MMKIVIPMAAALLLAARAPAAEHWRAPLPPAPDWSGRSESLVVEPDHPWVTPGEKSGLTETPSYAETIAWLERLAAEAPELAMVSLGRSAEGRRIRMVIASADRAFSPKAMAETGKPVVLAHAGIHSGEIDGKDAGLMLLRDMTVREKRDELLDGAHFLFIPVLNLDGHERRSPFSRMNQRGPERPGWRTNARNLNLNRDFAKLETAGVRAVAEVVNEWEPDLYLDLHVTDGVDYQYDITYGWNGDHAWSPAIAEWLDEHFRPTVDEKLRAWGHVPGPLIFAVNGRDLEEGIVEWTAPPRFSNGWGDARHLPSVLVENHSLKSYRRRVLGTYVFLAGALEAAAAESRSLRKAVAEDRERRPHDLVLAWETDPDAAGTMDFKGIRAETAHSPVTGTEVVRWTGDPVEKQVPVQRVKKPATRVARPEAYWIPAAWSDIAAILERHGVQMSRIDEAREISGTAYRLPEAQLVETGEGDATFTSEMPFEGRVRVTPGDIVPEDISRVLPPGSWRVPTDQPLGDLAMLLLEPGSPDSLFQWGYFHEVLQRTEYFEPYAMEPLARKMLEADPDLREAFQEKLETDRDFAEDPNARLMWFYEKTPYYDERYRVYPIVRKEASSK